MPSEHGGACMMAIVAEVLPHPTHGVDQIVVFNWGHLLIWKHLDDLVTPSFRPCAILSKPV